MAFCLPGPHRSSGQQTTEQCVLQAHGTEVRELIAAVDKQGSGFISYDSFEAVMARSMMQQAAAVQSPDLSSTVRLQPDSSALPFHEVPLLNQPPHLVCMSDSMLPGAFNPTDAVGSVGWDRLPVGTTLLMVGCCLVPLHLRWQAVYSQNPSACQVTIGNTLCLSTGNSVTVIGCLLAIASRKHFMLHPSIS